jgi:hypothetical protein
MPDPLGVLVMMTVPAFSFIPWLRCDTNLATGKFMSELLFYIAFVGRPTKESVHLAEQRLPSRLQ